MTDSAGLERRYRRLLAWYPRQFRREQEEEMFAVLMAGAREGQRRPHLLESANLIRNALVMRLRLARSGTASGGLDDALAVFSVVAPLFLLAASLLELALPYHLSFDPRNSFAVHLFPRHQLGGLLLLHERGFVIAVGCQVIIAGLVLLGLRWVALAAIAGSVAYWVVARYWIPDSLQLLSTSVYILETAALIASPGPRRGRQLLSWGHGGVLLLAAVAVQVSTLMNDATSPPARFVAGRQPGTWIYFVISVVLAAAAAAVAWRLNRYFLVLLAVMFYPYVMQLAFPSNSTDGNLIGHPIPSHLVLLYLPPLLAACAALITALPLRSRPPLPPDPGKPEPS